MPPGARVVVEQSAGVEWDGDLPDCPESGQRVMSCFDTITGERVFIPTAPPESDDDDGDEQPVVEVTGEQLVAAIRQYTRAQITPAPLIVQPDQTLHLVNLPVIVRTDPGAQTFDTTLLGLPVQIRAEPISYSWDFGDGTPVLNTTDPGAPYPDHTVHHTYTRTGDYQITLYTYWSGTFRIATGPWITIDGLGITATTSPTLDLQERDTALVG